MELTYSELTKRDVINISDGRCLGRVTDIKLIFPQGKLVGIFVPGRKVRRICRWFDKTQIYIDESKILKIGGDVILVDIRCSEECSKMPKPKPPKPPMPNNPCHIKNMAEDDASKFMSAFEDHDY